MNRREVYLERLQTATMDTKISVIRTLEAYGWLHGEYSGFSKTIGGIREVLDEVYPDNWDIIVKKNYESAHLRTGWNKKVPFTIEFVIHFPEFVITNKEDMSHTIRGMYIKLVPKQALNGELSFKTFRGKRMVATKEEIISQYQHSHIAGRAYTFSTEISDTAFSWKGFCLGSSEIIQALTMLRSKFSVGRFKLFLFQLHEYLIYESIEGTPYKYIHDVIGGGKQIVLNNNTSASYYKKLLAFRERWEVTKEIDFKLENGSVKVIDNDNLEEFLKTSSVVGNYQSKEIAQKDERGNYFGYKSIGNIPSHLRLELADEDKISFNFKGEIVKFKIHEQLEEVEKPFFINKYIKDYVKTRIEQDIETKRFRGYIIEQLNTPAYLTKKSGQDTVLVSEN